MSEDLIVQTLSSPIDTEEKLSAHIEALGDVVAWSKITILFDEGEDGRPTSILWVLRNDTQAVAVLRYLGDAESSARLVFECANEGSVRLSCWQGHRFSLDTIQSLDALDQICLQIPHSEVPLTPAKAKKFYTDIVRDTKKNGRGKDLSAPNKRAVLFASHGRCMFEGCGIDLTRSPEGVPGNFGYFGHNLSASELGTRGVRFMSAELSNDPENVLLLCDMHHRLVDVVAKVDYPAERLWQMRASFIAATDQLLDGLARTPIDVFTLNWLVHSQVVSPPSDADISDSLALIDARMRGRAVPLEDAQNELTDSSGAIAWSKIPALVEAVHERLIRQSRSADHRAGLFAFGPMPPLIALGASLGNKANIVPMLRHRDSERWYWPHPRPDMDWFEITGLDDLTAQEEEIVLEFALTARPPAIINSSTWLEKRVVTIQPRDGSYGNGVLGHPLEGYALKQAIQQLMLHLESHHSVASVHILPCASNAACVFLGQAFDNYHPDWIIYDFETNADRMRPRLKITNAGGGVEVHGLTMDLGRDKTESNQS
jgi:CBASS immunity sensor of nucleotide second messenger signals